MVRRTLTTIAGAALLALTGVALGPAFAHPGGTAADGAHMNRDTGVRHWHLEIPCAVKPCNVGTLDTRFLDYLDPPPEECSGLLDSIVAEARKPFWSQSKEHIIERTFEGINARCWRIPRAPPPGSIPFGEPRG